MPDIINPTRDTYRHGNLRHTLLEHGIALAREGGPAAVVLREATRRAGVVPNAAYRHFKNRQDLLEAVRAAALAHLARAIETEIDAVQHLHEPHQRARAAFRGVGLGYLRFARQEPGLFRTAFAARPFDVKDTGEDPLTDDSPRGASGMDPFQLLGHTLDDMVAAGLLPAAQRPGAEWMAWSAVHGMAFLVLGGPLRSLDEPECQALAERLVLMVERGLLAAPGM
ncbi:TetR/AcrR family transcriptional regulator [Castellaniella sp.]|uniref:TetR/AcrR family transcriptional regulator n=1 Tax=Castellaniella sp. TaxID=1955812 RepID=UPI002AFE9C5F|nr:TetR/AcrR family transcriptional regulator [Castellaniella sp.]